VNRPDPIAGNASKQRLRLWLALLKTSRQIEAEVRERLRTRHATTLPRFDVMAALYRAGTGLKMSELSGELRVSNGNVTGIVGRLVADGQVVRVPVEGDRRAMLVRLTAKGREVFAGLAGNHEDWINQMLGGIDGARAVDLATELRGITSFIDEEPDT